MSSKKLDMNKVDSRLAKIYTFQGDKRDQYDQWATDYDRDLLNELGYVAHLRAAEIFARVVPARSAKVLDMGCGSGLVGKTLRELGYAHLDGADFSPKMLDLARQRGVYQNLRQHDITKPMDCEPYDALISVGLFSYGVPELTELHHVVDCVAVGSRCVVTVNGSAWVEHDLDVVLREQVKRYGFTLEEVITTDYLLAENINARVLVLRR